ncbi:MAG: calcium/sodium antiporter [Lachnospiraceae bacterium]|nr:calcium/sodium antiporter [Lachnospiraceae bacterium]
MLAAVVLFIVGLVLLIKGGDWFVDGATGIAKRFHVPELLIGATVVSIGTTLPEVMVSATSAVGGHGEIAYGNAIGSVICNTALIAGLTIAIKPSKVERKTLRTPVAFFFAAAVFYMVTAYTAGRFSRVSGLLLLLIFLVYMVSTVMQIGKMPGQKVAEEPLLQAASLSSREESSANPVSEEEKSGSMGKDLLLLVVGAALIAVGARLLVDNGTYIAQAIGVPESVIALTFVALGTSLPELVTAITSLAKGHGALSLGNIIGANLFNLVLVSGLSVTLAPFDIPQNATIAGYNASLVLDIPVMLFVMLFLTIPALAREKLTRFQGIVLLLVYGAFCAIQFTI